MAMSIDGPYGNRDTANKLAYYDKTLLIAGGSGTGYSLPLLESILGDPTSTAEVHVTIAVRDSTSVHWVVDEFEPVLGSHIANRKVQVDIHITDDAAPTSGEIKTDEESGKTALGNSAPVVLGNRKIAVIYGLGQTRSEGAG
jgi:NAD(P)H-flavin reductase